VRRRLNATLPDDLAIVRVARRPWGFHARYDAIWREYRYRIWSGGPQPLARPLVWHRAERLDVGAMDRAAGRLVGELDFAALAGGGAGVPWSAQRERTRGTVRTVMRCGCREREPWWQPPDGTGALIELQIVADGFLPRMVRTIAAMLVEVGRGARPETWVDDLLATHDRRSGAGTAPPHGLIFWRVGYGSDRPDPDLDDRTERKGA
jgi:tRNA pseudouridine38-40 synthase